MPVIMTAAQSRKHRKHVLTITHILLQSSTLPTHPKSQAVHTPPLLPESLWGLARLEKVGKLHGLKLIAGKQINFDPSNFVASRVVQRAHAAAAPTAPDAVRDAICMSC